MSVALAYGALFATPLALGAIAIGIPLMGLNWKPALISGLLIGLLAPLSLYLFYPISAVNSLSGILSQITGIPPFLLILLYPVFYSLIAMVSALFFSGFREFLQSRGREEGKPNK